MKLLTVLFTLLCCSFSLLPSPSLASDSTENPIDCEKAFTTYQINKCAYQVVESNEATLQTYFQKSLEQFENDKETQTAIIESQKAWAQYATAHCSAVYSPYRDGTIRTLIRLSCRSLLIQQRTTQLWSDYLVLMEGTELYPKPSFDN